MTEPIRKEEEMASNLLIPQKVKAHNLLIPQKWKSFSEKCYKKLQKGRTMLDFGPRTSILIKEYAGNGQKQRQKNS